MWFPIPFCCVAFLCSVIALGLPYWAVYDHNGFGEVGYGVIQVYFAGSRWEYTSPTGTMIAVRVLQSLGSLLLIASIILAIVKQCSGTDRPTLFRIAAGLAFLAGVIILIGVIIFGTQKELQIVINRVASAENYRFHAGFYLAIVGGILSFLAGLLLIFDKPISDRRREKAQEQDLAVFHDSSKRKVVGYHDYYETGHRPISVHNNGFGYADSRVLSTPEYRYYARSSRVKNFAL